MSTELHPAAASRPSDELQRLLTLIDRRSEYHRRRALALARIRGVLETELERRAAWYGLDLRPGGSPL
jgi:hypothetical protein